jgi:hypothetical protein
MLTKNKAGILLDAVGDLKGVNRLEPCASNRQNQVRVMSALVTCMIMEDSVRFQIVRLPRRSRVGYKCCPVNEEHHAKGLALDLLSYFNTVPNAIKILRRYFDHAEPCANLIHVSMSPMGIGPVY